MASFPKTNDVLIDLMERGIVLDLGKEVNGVGRKPNFFSLKPEAAYFLAVEVNRFSVSLALMNFVEEMVHIDEQISYRLENTQRRSSH